MSEILAPLALGIVRFFLGLFEFLGFLWETDFCLTQGFFSAKAFGALYKRVRHRKTS